MFEHSSTRECPSCALSIDAHADVCPYCGYDLPRTASSIKVAAIVFAVLLLWPLFELVRYLLR